VSSKGKPKVQGEMEQDTLLRASGELLMPMCISIQLEDEEIDEVV
jgi:hypothetical protein